MNKLVWGFYFDDINDIELEKDNSTKTKFYTLVNFHRLSINKAKLIGYECYLYTPKYLHKYFYDLNINLKDIPNVGNIIFDYVKNYILKVEKGDYLIIDGDLILNNRLPNLTADLLYEKNEVRSWNEFYNNQVILLNKKGIGDIIPEWSGKKYNQIINIGLFQIYNNEFKKICIDRWDTIKEFIEKEIGFESGYTTVAGQYIITELVNYYKPHTKDFKSLSPKDTYIHYMGDIKFEKKFIPHDRILILKQSII